jgi:hypothetical protein
MLLLAILQLFALHGITGLLIVVVFVIHTIDIGVAIEVGRGGEQSWRMSSVHV